MSRCSSGTWGSMQECCSLQGPMQRAVHCWATCNVLLHIGAPCKVLFHGGATVPNASGQTHAAAETMHGALPCADMGARARLLRVQVLHGADQLPDNAPGGQDCPGRAGWRFSASSTVRSHVLKHQVRAPLHLRSRSPFEPPLRCLQHLPLSWHANTFCCPGMPTPLQTTPLQAIKHAPKPDLPAAHHCGK